jgi:hypothetical protein
LCRRSNFDHQQDGGDGKNGYRSEQRNFTEGSSDTTDIAPHCALSRYLPAALRAETRIRFNGRLRE